MANEVIPFENLTKEMATAYQVAPAELISTVKAMCFDKGAASDPQLFVFLTVAKQLDLNPFNREIYAFVSGSKMQTIVGFDGWVKLSVRHPAFGGFEFFDHVNDKGELTAVTCRMWRKDWGHSAEATEYLDECRGTTDPWKKWPHRMLRNKAYIQCARMTFGFAGVVDPDEAERIAAPANWKDQSIDISPEQSDNGSAAAPVVSGATPDGGQASAKDDPPPGETAETPATTATQATPPSATVASGAQVNPRERLAVVFEKHERRVTLQLGKLGKTSIDDLTDDEVATILAKTDK